MDESIKYNLRNPAFTDDIGYSMINRMYPGTVNPITGTADSQIGNVNLNSGQPQQDTYEKTQKSKDNDKIKKLLVGVGGVVLAILGFKKGKLIVNFVKGLFKNGIKLPSAKNILNNVKNFGTNIIDKVKNIGPKFKSSPSSVAGKAKNIFGKAKDFIVKNLKKIKK